jgi:hypothetical protein
LLCAFRQTQTQTQTQCPVPSAIVYPVFYWTKKKATRRSLIVGQ